MDEDEIEDGGDLFEKPNVYDIIHVIVAPIIGFFHGLNWSLQSINEILENESKRKDRSLRAIRELAADLERLDE